MNLTNFGFTEFFHTQTTELTQLDKYKTLIPGRVTVEHKHSYRIITVEGEILAAVSGHFAFHAFERQHYPAVGDWVLLEKLPGEEKGVIHKLLDRKSVFSRKIAGLEIDEQIIASNVDIVFIVTSLNDDFNIRRIERYITAAWNSGATPVILLTKADLCENVDDFVDEVATVALGVEIIPISTLTGLGLSTVHELLQPNHTAALLGSSGVGKSTLTNALLEENLMTTQTIREDDARGRHTTTHRELFALPTGGVIIDTPGMRELQLWNNGDALDSSFSDIKELAEICKFRDCTHKKEPGCAVRHAIESGSLDEIRLSSYFKLLKEIAYIDAKTAKQTTAAKAKQQKILYSRKRQ
ncbi:ribosome small subunit-dependent GTPase A [Kurthia sibirica]|uniref:Small ribosomal subunit biogenesis GTPase RsgA n=1 Tax=Kurthia sibirica TaxID=202750 RepID=A0A2U3AG07_9BACL|nr:ribosome small subunit-dependent GTPase A [Kurthia sibirica]PWI23381.1 ribosome small subunit-dependent GTPase A [Kurthia sibirica]GEK35380.1 putative ribosome biogenesis GTPase RsgA [Kurthia sibirica]